MGKKAVQFGAGNIGRGFIGQLLSESGYEVVFVDIADDIVRLINERREYPIEIASDTRETVIIRNVRAVHGLDKERVANEVSEADIVCTAVGVNALPHISPSIALGIRRRAEKGISDPLNIIICENLLHASDVLRGYILTELPPENHEYLRKHVGFVESVVSRMVPIMTEEQKKRDPLLVIVEAYKKLPVDRKGFVGEIPQVVGLLPYDNFNAYVERKLFTHNLGHAAAAYLGYLRGHQYIWQAMKDPEVRMHVEGALGETGQALIKRHGFTPEEHQDHIDDLLVRFSNVALGDQVSRVGKDPMRKLGRNDRLIGSGMLCLEYGIKPTNVSLATAAALMFDPPGDPSAGEVQRILSQEGLDGVFRRICDIEPESELASMIREQFRVIKSGEWPGKSNA